MKINYSATGRGSYAWTFESITGTVAKSGNGWRAVVTHDNGVAVVTPMGGRVTGHADTRQEAARRAVGNQRMTDSQRWINMMNT
jgi:hypothetical protein